MTYIGIDPGKKGGYAIIDSENDICATFPWDDSTFMQHIAPLCGEEQIVCLEHVGPMPKQGVSSTFLFGREFGFIQGVLRAYNIPFELVRPQKWKKEFSVTADKNTSIEVCKRLFPAVSLLPTERCRKESDGMAEALLMAEYARRHFSRK